MGRKKYTDPSFKKKFSDLYRHETTAELSEKFKVRPQAVNEWKKGINIPDVGTLVAISKDKNISLDFLLGDAPPHSLDGDYKSAVVATGLSEKTITALKEWFNGYGVIILNRFVESGHYEALMIDLIKGIKVSQFYGNDEKGIPTKDDWIGYYSKEMGSVLNAFMYDILKDLADARISEKVAERIITKITEIESSMTPEQRKAKMDIMGSEYYYKKLFEQVDKELDEEV